MDKDKNKKKSPSALTYMIDGVRLFFWPRGGWRRTIRYIVLQMARMPSSPYALAIGFASGAFVSFSPFLGLHFLLAAAIAWVLRGNMIASALGTIVGNPLSFPFIWAGDYILGFWILHGKRLSFEQAKIPRSLTDATDIFYPILVGGVPLGLAVGALTFALVYFSVRVYRKRKALEKAQAND